MEIASRKQLFFDNAVIEHMEGMRRLVNQPQKHSANPVMVADRPWEHDQICLYGTVLFDGEENLYKMWYQMYDRWAKEPTRRNAMCYATSQDGIQWHKQNVGLFPFQRSYENNIVMVGHTYADGFSVLKDHRDLDPLRKYKTVYLDVIDGFVGVCVAVSPNGIHWTPYPNNPVIPINSDTHHPLIWDDGIGKYIAYLRPGFVDRRVARAESSDGFRWSQPQVVLEPDDKDSPDDQFYNLAAFRYEGIYFGLLSVFHTDPSEEGPFRMKGHTDVELVCSRDGIKWQRPARGVPYIPRGEEGEFDSLQIYCGCTTIVVRDEIRIYYCGLDVPHEISDRSAVGLVTLRPDGFFSLDADSSGGRMTTKPFTFTGQRLVINAEVNRGILTVELLDAEGKAIPGYSRDECQAIQVGGIELEVCWTGTSDVGTLQGQPVRLRFDLQQAKLFAFQFLA